MIKVIYSMLILFSIIGLITSLLCNHRAAAVLFFVTLVSTFIGFINQTNRGRWGP